MLRDFIAIASVCLLLSSFALGSETASSLLGRGIDRSGHLLAGCLQGTPQFFSRSYQQINYELSHDRMEQVQRHWGQVGGSVNFFLIGGGLSVEWLAETARSQRSLSLLFNYKTQLGSLQLRHPRLSERAEALQQSSLAALQSACGQHFIHKIDLGARMMLAVTLHFRSAEAYERFVKTIKISVLFGLISKTKRFVEETNEFTQDFAIKVSALQWGGEPSQLEAILGSKAKHSCRADAMQSCLELIAELQRYIGAENGLASQLKFTDTSSELAWDRLQVLQIYNAAFAESGFDQWPAALPLEPSSQGKNWDHAMGRLMRLYQTRSYLELDALWQAESDASIGERISYIESLIEEQQRLIHECFQWALSDACHKLEHAPALPEYIIN